MISNDYFVRLPNEMFNNLEIANEELTILILLYRNYIQCKSLSLCSIEMMLGYMKTNQSKDRKNISITKDIIKSLLDKKYILGLYSLNYKPITIDDIEKEDKYYTFYAELEKPPETHFFMIKDYEIDKIFDCVKGVNVNKYSLIRYFIACKRVSNNDQKFGYLSQTFLKKLINDSKTIQRYNDILQDLELIRYNNSYLTKNKYYETTYIGSFDNDNFDEQVKTEAAIKGLTFTNKTKSNKKREIKQKINNLSKTELEIENDELKRQIEEYKKMQYVDKNKTNTEEKSNNTPDNLKQTQNKLSNNNDIDNKNINSKSFNPKSFFGSAPKYIEVKDDSEEENKETIINDNNDDDDLWNDNKISLTDEIDEFVNKCRKNHSFIPESLIITWKMGNRENFEAYKEASEKGFI